MSKFNFKSRIPRYNDDSDYTTNAPSYYDDLARKNKLIKELAKRIWEYEKTLHESLEEIENILNDYINIVDGKIEIIDHVIGEGFNDRIEVLLREWVNDGTLNHIINEEIFNDLNSKIDQVDNDLNEFRDQVDNDLNEFRDQVDNDLNEFRDQVDNDLNCIKKDVYMLGEITFFRG